MQIQIEFQTKSVQLKRFLIQTEISRDLKVLKLYWNCLSQDGKQHVQQLRRLDNILACRKGQIHKALIEKQKNSNVPDLVFVYDEYEDRHKAVTQLLDEIRPELRDHEPFDARHFVPPSKVISEAFEHIKPKFFKKQVTAYDQHEAIRQRFAYEKKQSALLGNEKCEFEHPPEMRLNSADLDYKTLINQVLFYLSRSRSEITREADKVNIPSDWIPPIQSNSGTMSGGLQDDETTSLPTSTEDRLKMMKRFLIEHRRKKRKETRQSMLSEMKRNELISESLQEAEQRWNLRYEHDLDDFDHGWQSDSNDYHELN